MVSEANASICGKNFNEKTITITKTIIFSPRVVDVTIFEV